MPLGRGPPGKLPLRTCLCFCTVQGDSESSRGKQMDLTGYDKETATAIGLWIARYLNDKPCHICGGRSWVVGVAEHRQPSLVVGRVSGYVPFTCEGCGLTQFVHTSNMRVG